MIPTRAEMLVLLRMKAMRDRRGFRWCKKRGIGPMRMAAASPVVVPINGISSELREIERIESEAAELLRQFCVRCNGCEWAHR